MSRENVEIVRRIYDEIDLRLEFPGEWFAPDCVTDWTDVAPDGGIHRGVDAANAAIAPYFETFEHFRVVAEEIVFADEERVVAEIRDGGRLSGSQAEVTNRYFHAWSLEGGKVVRLSAQTDRGQALEAVGLQE